MGTASINALISYYGFAIPLALLFTFFLGNGGKGLGLNGVWYGMFSGQLFLVLVYQYYISFKFDWNKIAQECQERTERDKKLITKEEI